MEASHEHGTSQRCGFSVVAILPRFHGYRFSVGRHHGVPLLQYNTWDDFCFQAAAGRTFGLCAVGFHAKDGTVGTKTTCYSSHDAFPQEILELPSSQPRIHRGDTINAFAFEPCAKDLTLWGSNGCRKPMIAPTSPAGSRMNASRSRFDKIGDDKDGASSVRSRSASRGTLRHADPAEAAFGPVVGACFSLNFEFRNAY
jgi:hypothetical protein